MATRNNRLSLPDQHSEIAPALLVLIFRSGGCVAPANTYEPLADFFELSDEQRNARRKDPTKGKEWHTYVMFARELLKKDGMLDARERGKWRLTPQGSAKAEALSRVGLWKNVPSARTARA